MFKRFLAAVATMAIMATLLPTSAFAADVFVNMISSVKVTSSDTANVVGVDDDPFFNPADSETVTIDVDFNKVDFESEVNASKGSIKIYDAKTGKVVKNLLTWDNSAVTNPILDDKKIVWDGKGDSSSTTCDGVACPVGVYYVEVEMTSALTATTNFIDMDGDVFDISTIELTNFKFTPSTGKFKPADGNFEATFNADKNGFVNFSVHENTQEQKLVREVVKNHEVTTGPNASVKLTWDGKDNDGNFVKSGGYLLFFSSSLTSGGTIIDNDDIYFVEVEAPANASLKKFEAKGTLGSTSFDPSSKGANEDLNITYEFSEEMDSVEAVIKNSDDDLVKSFVASATAKKSGTFTWDGVFALNLVEPGAYEVEITAKKANQSTITDKKTVNVVYSNSQKADINDFSIAPTAFDPDVEDAVISFKNDADADIYIEIENPAGDVVRKFTDYQGDFYNANDTHSVAWNGKNTSGSTLALGKYTARVITRNDFGVAVKTAEITINNSGGSVSTNNAHIAGISFSPSSKFEPAEDDQLEIEFDVEKDLDSLRIVAVRGTKQVEIYDEDGIEEENNVETTWEGTDDDDEYVEEGSWKIMFYSKVDSQELVASKSIEISYDKPKIDDFYVTKDKFDNDLDEFTTVMFRIDAEAVVTIEILEGGSTDDTVVEDMEVEKDTWYSVEWDGGSYDYDDDIDLKIIAANVANEDVYSTDKESINLEEDDVSSSRSNVTNDYITPALTDGDSEMSLFYSLEEDADVEITIHKGKSGSGSKIIELLSVSDQESGEHEIVWNGKDKNGKKLSDGFYTYKIVSRLKSNDTETGLFIIGDDIDGGSSSSSSSSSGSSNVSNQVISVNGGNDPEVEVNSGNSTDSSDCGGFGDVSKNSSYCEAIDWVEESGIFEGYADGQFKPFKSINRVEVLKVLLEAMNISGSHAGGNLGFKDVQVGAWYMPYISAAKNLGIFSGDAGKGTARPGDTVNRAEMLKFVFETLEAADSYNMSVCKSNYSDASGQWYSKYACEAKRYSLFDGSNLYPSALSTRGEVAEVLYRLHLAGAL